MDNAEILASVPIFTHMKKEDLDRISNLIRLDSFKAGDVIIREGERDRRLFVILKGQVEVIKNYGTKKEVAVDEFGPLGYFGEMSLIDDSLRSASVVAKDETEVMILDHLDLHKEIGKYPQMAIELLQVLSRRIRQLETTFINTLGAFLPICANCGKIREKDGAWSSVEEYISGHLDTEFTHSICPGCAEILYPEISPPAKGGVKEAKRLS